VQDPYTTANRGTGLVLSVVELIQAFLLLRSL